jgi:hypothetical protein
VQRLFRTLCGAAAVGAVLLIGLTPQARAQQKKKDYKDAGEFPAYDAAAKDIGANPPNFAKAVTDLDAWKQKYPESDFKDERAALYVQAYAGTNQPGKALDQTAELLTRDLTTVFPGPEGAPTVIRLLYNAAWAIGQLPDPTPEQLAAGEKAARALNAYDQKLQGVTDAQWAQVRADMQQKAQAALLYVAMLPGNQAYTKKNYPAAEAAYAKALQDYPNNAAISYQLGLTLRAQPDKFAQAVYQFQRAAVLDATLGNPKNDPKQVQTYADNAYIRLHGGTDGLDQLKEMVKQSPMPPADFKIKTTAEVAAEKEAQFEKSNPQLALWMKIKGQLADTNGDQYFATQLKDAAVPQLRGTLVDAKPACHPKELLVAVPLPDAQQPLRAEITLKLEKAMTGKPELNSEFQWEGVPSAFSKDPFMLSMDTPNEKIGGLKSTPCIPGGAKKSVGTKKGVAKKK